MCECGCSDMAIDRALRIERSRMVLGYQIYDGCEDCFSGPAVDIYLFEGPRNLWLEGVDIEDAEKPDQCNGFRTQAHVPLFQVEDLKAEAAALEEHSPGADYNSIEDWLDELGLDLIQGAMRRFRQRMRDRARREKAK